MIDQPVLQGAHQQVDSFAPQTMPLRLVGDALQRQPAGERILAAQCHAVNGKAGRFRREGNLTEAGGGPGKCRDPPRPAAMTCGKPPVMGER